LIKLWQKKTTKFSIVPAKSLYQLTLTTRYLSRFIKGSVKLA